MAVTLDQTIEQKQHNWFSLVLTSQAFWVLIAIIARLRLPVLRDRRLRHPKNLYNITRNFTFTAIVALGMTMVIITGGIDLSVGSVLCLCSMVLAVTMHAGVQHLRGHFRLGATALVVGASTASWWRTSAFRRSW